NSTFHLVVLSVDLQLSLSLSASLSFFSFFTPPFLFFFFNDPATTEIYTLSLHDALPISARTGHHQCRRWLVPSRSRGTGSRGRRSEEHTSELQSRSDLVCRLLLEKKKKIMKNISERLKAVQK